MTPHSDQTVLFSSYLFTH